MHLQGKKEKSVYITEEQNTVSSEVEVSDSLLWQSFIGKSESAFVNIYNDYFQVLYEYGKHLTNDSELIKDIVQDLFIGLRANRSKLPKVSSVKAFLLKSLRNKIYDHFRKSTKHKFIPFSESTHNFKVVESHETLLINRQIANDQIQQIRRGMAHLSPKKREALHLFYYNCLSYKEISEILGFSSVKSTRTLIYRALDEIRGIE